MIRKSILALVVIIVLLIAAALVVPNFLPEATYKNAAIAQVKKMTGRDLKVDGKFKVKLFPSVGATMENVSLSDAPGGNGPMIALKSLDVEVSVVPLFSGQVEVKKLTLDNPVIQLRVNKDGSNNWQLVPGGNTAPKDAKPDAKVVKYKTSSPLPSNLLLSDVKISNGEVHYDDQQAGSRWDIRELDTKVELNGLLSPFNISGSGQWNGRTVSVKGTVATPETLANGQRTSIKLAISSDVLSVETNGNLEKQLYTGKASVNSPSLKEALKWIDAKTKLPEMSAPLKLALASDMECSLTACHMNNATLTLDKIEAKGTVGLSKDNGLTQLNLDLATNTLDFNPYLPPEKKADGGSFLFADAYAAAPGSWSDEPFNFAPLRTANVVCNIQTDGIIYRDITIGKALLRAKLQSGRLSADVVNAELYGGKGSVALNVDTNVVPPTIGGNVALEKVDAQKLLSNAAHFDRLNGTIDLQMITMSRGKSEREIISSLAGNGNFKVNNGELLGIDVAAMSKNIGAAFNADPKTQKTVFSNMGGTVTISQGIASNRDLVLETQGLRVGGAGDINLPQRSINYRLSPQMTSTDKTTGAVKEGIAVPILITGSIDNPHYGPDVKGALQDALSDPKKFKEELKNSRGTLKDQLKDSKGALKGVKGLLKGFKGQPAN